MKNNKIFKFLIPPLCVLGIMLFVYAIKGIYPFGQLTIANGDFGQSYIPFYYLLYDAIIKGKSILYDYILGMGSNVYGGFIVDGLLNPTALIILLNSRANIPYMLSFVMIIKMAFIALTSYILFYKFNKENHFYNVIFSILYAFSGYVLTYNTNIMWLDVVGLFPLFILATKYMFETDKTYWYAIVLALILIFNYNLAYMVLMFIIFILPIYIRFGIEKENRKKATFNVIIGTILSVGLSSFALIPSFIQVMSSYRMSGAVTNTVRNVNLLYKIAIFIFYSLPIYGYIKYIKYRKEDKTWFRILSLSLLFSAILPIIFERINLLWHTGSYQLFPIRYGFIPILILYLGALRYFNKFEKEENKETSINLIQKICAILLSVASIVTCVINAKIINTNDPAFTMDAKIFSLMLICMVAFVFVLYVIYKIKNNKIKAILVSSIVVFQVVIYIYGYVGVPIEFRKGTEWSDEGIFISNTINEKLKDKEGTNYRIKDLTQSYTENCALVHNIPSMQTFLHIISKEQILNHEQLGYSKRVTKLNDFGGTLISDAIYGVRYVLSKENLPEELYNYICNVNEEIKIYELKNYLPYGILYDNEIEKIPNEIFAFDAQNYLYKNLFNKENDIIEIKRKEGLEELGKNKYKIELKTDKKVELYINNVYNDYIYNIKVNGKLINIPLLNDQDNVGFPTTYCDGILDLGYFNENTEIVIEFESDDEITNEDRQIELGLLDIDEYIKVINENQNDFDIKINGNKIKIVGKADKKEKLFIPINYDKGWKILNSDKQINLVYNTFMGIDLEEGYNEIELEFKPYLFDISIKITLATIILMIIMFLLDKFLNFKIQNIKWIMFIFWIIGLLIYIIAFFKFYIMSIFQTIISLF